VTTVTPALNGGATFSVSSLPGGAFEAWFVFTTTAPLGPGDGPVFGITPDATTFLLISTFIVAQPGNPIHHPANAPPPWPLTLGPGAMSSFSGQTWDFLSVVFDGLANILAVSNVERVTWP
jgi:hypothetical protein